MSEAESSAVPRRVWGATAWLIAGRFFAALCTLASLAILARQLALGEFGRLTFYLAILALLDPLVDFGTSTAALQRGAAGPEALARAVASGRKIRTVSAVCGAVILTTGAALAREASLAWILAAALVPLTRPLELSSVVYADRIAWRTPVAIRSASAALRLAGVAALAGAGVASFGPFLFLHAAAAGLGNVALHLVVRARMPRTGDGPRFDRGLLAAAAPLALAAVAQQGYFYADNFVVRALRGEEALGHYNAAVRILSFAVILAGFATQAALPWLARRHRAGDLRRATLRLTLPLAAAALVGVAILWPHAGRLLTLAFGPGFEAAEPSLRWLLAAVCVVHVGAAPLTAVVASGRARSLLAIVLAGLLANLVANLFLVRSHGIEGAAMATLGTELLVAAASIAVLLRRSARPCT